MAGSMQGAIAGDPGDHLVLAPLLQMAGFLELSDEKTVDFDESTLTLEATVNTSSGGRPRGVRR